MFETFLDAWHKLYPHSRAGWGRDEVSSFLEKIPGMRTIDDAVAACASEYGTDKPRYKIVHRSLCLD